MFKVKRYGWTLSIAYNSMLSCALALMAKSGFWPDSDSHHLAAISYCSHALGSESSALISLFNRYRIKRHDSVYGEEDQVSETEAKNAIKYSKEFLQAIRQKLL